MVYGYALEPELVATWGNKADYRYFFDKFGLGQPRMMVEFPKLKNWRRQVLQAATGIDGQELQKVTAMIGILTEQMISRIPHAEYDGVCSWLENAEHEHSANPFHLILAKDNPRGLAAIIRGASLGDQPEPRWEVGRNQVVSRKATDMSNVVTAMLRNSSMVIFVDPHFGPENIRHRRPLEAFLSVLKENRGCPISNIEVLTSTNATFDFFRNACEQRLPRIIPAGMNVNFIKLAEHSNGEQLHNRYIMTDIGGVTFNIGLDDGDDGQTDDVALMDRKQYELRWTQYSGTSPAFVRTGEVRVIGVAR
jgi:hypothetical protein